MHDCIDGEGTDAFHAKLFHDVLAMTDYRCKADIELIADFLIDISLCNQRQHFDFSVAEQLGFQCSWHVGKILPAGMSVLLELQ